MSRQAPIYISDSEEEPMEESFVPESPSVHDRATSDDTYVPPTQRVTTPAPACPVDEPHYHLGETSCRSRLVSAPRKCIRDLPTGLLASRGKAPVTDTEEPPQRRFPHQDWMPDMLSRWRELEDVPSTLEIGESSRPLPFTGEPLELTTITLVVVVRALFDTLWHAQLYQRVAQRHFPTRWGYAVYLWTSKHYGDPRGCRQRVS